MAHLTSWNFVMLPELVGAFGGHILGVAPAPRPPQLHRWLPHQGCIYCSTNVFSWHSISGEALFLERLDDSAGKCVTCFAAAAVAGHVRSGEVIGHLGPGDVQLHVATTFDIQTARHVRHNVVLNHSSFTARLNVCIVSNRLTTAQVYWSESLATIWASVWLQPYTAKQCPSAHNHHQSCHCITFSKPPTSCLV